MVTAFNLRPLSTSPLDLISLNAAPTRENLSKAKLAWQRKTLGEDLDSFGTDDRWPNRVKRESQLTWSHISAARLAIGAGVVHKARASYNYYLQRFQNNSAIFVTDVCLRLAIFEQNHGNSTGAKRAFCLGARTVQTALARGDKPTALLRERGAAIFCSWGLHEYKYGSGSTSNARLKRSVGLFRQAVSLDASKAPILRWRRFEKQAMHDSISSNIGGKAAAEEILDAFRARR